MYVNGRGSRRALFEGKNDRGMTHRPRPITDVDRRASFARPADTMFLDHLPVDVRELDAQARFAALSALFDQVTARRLTGVGLASGWRCWEVDAGGPRLPGLIAERVGPLGRVVATTDRDLTWLDAGLPASVQARRHDVVRDDPPAGGFDLVHARLVLMHLPERDEVLRRLVAALRPGGWLLVEDFDCDLQPLACLGAGRPEELLANRVRAEFLDLLARRGADLEYGRKLPRLFRDAGLVEVGADGFFPVAVRAGAALEIAEMRRAHEGLLASGRIRADELDAHLASVAWGRVDVTTPPLFGCWGQRPE